MFLTAKNSKYHLSENLPGYDFLVVNSEGRVSVTKIRVYSLIDAESPRRTTLHRKNLSLCAPVMTLKKQGTINFKQSKCSTLLHRLKATNRTELHVANDINGMKILLQTYQFRLPVPLKGMACEAEVTF